MISVDTCTIIGCLTIIRKSCIFCRQPTDQRNDTSIHLCLGRRLLLLVVQQSFIHCFELSVLWRLQLNWGLGSVTRQLAGRSPKRRQKRQIHLYISTYPLVFANTRRGKGIFQYWRNSQKENVGQIFICRCDQNILWALSSECGRVVQIHGTGGHICHWLPNWPRPTWAPDCQSDWKRCWTRLSWTRQVSKRHFTLKSIPFKFGRTKSPISFW